MDKGGEDDCPSQMATQGMENQVGQGALLSRGGRDKRLMERK